MPIIYKLLKKYHTSEFLRIKNMKWLHFKERIKYKLLCITHTTIYKQIPIYILQLTLINILITEHCQQKSTNKNLPTNLHVMPLTSRKLPFLFSPYFMEWTTIQTTIRTKHKSF